jgi:predicted metal-binding protein
MFRRGKPSREPVQSPDRTSSVVALPAFLDGLAPRPLARVLICAGCCCGHPEKGNAEVPVDWLQREWERRGLRPKASLSIPYCMGPCERANVAALRSNGKVTWLGGLSTREQYEAILDWAQDTVDEGKTADLPKSLARRKFEPRRY